MKPDFEKLTKIVRGEEKSEAQAEKEYREAIEDRAYWGALLDNAQFPIVREQPKEYGDIEITRVFAQKMFEKADKKINQYRRSSRYGKLVRGWDWRTTPERLERAERKRKELKLSRTEFLEKAIDLFIPHDFMGNFQ